MEPLNRPGESSKLIYEIGDHIKGTEFLKKLRHLIYQNLKFKGKNFHFFGYCCDRFQIQVRNKSRCDFQTFQCGFHCEIDTGCGPALAFVICSHEKNICSPCRIKATKDMHQTSSSSSTSSPNIIIIIIIVNIITKHHHHRRLH